MYLKHDAATLRIRRLDCWHLLFCVLGLLFLAFAPCLMDGLFGSDGHWNRFLHVYRNADGSVNVRSAPDGPPDQLVASVRITLSTASSLPIPFKRRIHTWEQVVKTGPALQGFTIGGHRAQLARELDAGFSPPEPQSRDTPRLRAAYAQCVQTFASGGTGPTSTSVWHWPGVLSGMGCWMMLLGALLLPAALLNRAIFWSYRRSGRHRLRQGQCPHCGYPSAQGRCSECGVDPVQWKRYSDLSGVARLAVLKGQSDHSELVP